MVDPSNFIVESDESDNRATAALMVDAQDAPNLVVQSSNIGFDPPSPMDGDLVTLTVTILNNGSADANDVLVQFVDATDGGAEPIGRKQTIATHGRGRERGRRPWSMTRPARTACGASASWPIRT